MSIAILEVSRAERPALVSHFLLLAPEDRRLRFGTPLSDDSVRQYVERIDFEHDAVFAVADDDQADQPFAEAERRHREPSPAGAHGDHSGIVDGEESGGGLIEDVQR